LEPETVSSFCSFATVSTDLQCLRIFSQMTREHMKVCKCKHLMHSVTDIPLNRLLKARSKSQLGHDGMTCYCRYRFLISFKTTQRLSGHHQTSFSHHLPRASHISSLEFQLLQIKSAAAESTTEPDLSIFIHNYMVLGPQTVSVILHLRHLRD
jgi:hypothetical protein